MPEKGACGECGELISLEASKCPECDHSPKNTQMGLSIAIGAIGGFLTITVIGAIIGIPLVLISLLMIVVTLVRPPNAATAVEE